MRISLTVFFEDPFWVGVFERIDDGKLSACKQFRKRMGTGLSGFTALAR
jgi:hypothetical protein